MRTLLYTILLLGFSFQANASWRDYRVDTFKCSNGKQYNVVRHVVGGDTQPMWQFVSVCKQGLVKRSRYSGHVASITQAHKDVQACANEINDTSKVDILDCSNEFVELNGLKGLEGKELKKTEAGIIKSSFEKVEDFSNYEQKLPQVRKRTLKYKITVTDS